MRWRSPKDRRSRRLRQPRARVRDRARRGLAILPSLLTLGNLVCGFFAIVHVGAVEWKGGAPVPANAFEVAAIAILLAMVFDMLDGRVARMTRTTSDFGAQLDSLADAVTFGVAPGVLVAMTHAMGRYDFQHPFWSKLAWVFGAAYACGAVIRLARFNIESESHEESAHRYFKGLPSPAAAGVIATLVLLNHFLLYSDRADARLAWIKPTLIESFGHRILDVLPFVALGVGYLMVSKFRYVHVANVYLKGRKPAEYLTAAIFGGVLAALFPEIVAALLFCGFALSGPTLALRAWWRRGGPGPDGGAPASESLPHTVPLRGVPTAAQRRPAPDGDAPPAEPAAQEEPAGRPPEGEASGEPTEAQQEASRRS